MSYNFPSSNYTSDDEYDVDIHTSPFLRVKHLSVPLYPLSLHILPHRLSY